MLKKASPTNLVVALLAALLEKLKPATTLVVDMVAHNAKCSLLFALLAEKRPPFLSNQLATSRYIAVIATLLVSVTTGKINL
jgi:hypothetical protein